VRTRTPFSIRCDGTHVRMCIQCFDVCSLMCAFTSYTDFYTRHCSSDRGLLLRVPRQRELRRHSLRRLQHGSTSPVFHRVHKPHICSGSVLLSHFSFFFCSCKQVRHLRACCSRMDELVLCYFMFGNCCRAQCYIHASARGSCA
jgi:hypothetical protein